MRGQLEFFDLDDRLKRLSDLGDRLEAFRAAVDFELFRAELNVALSYSDGSEGGRPPFDPVMMFKILVIQATNNVSDERAEFLINDRLSFMRFLGLGLADRVPDARTILFREKLTNAGAIKTLFQRFDATLRQAGLYRHVGTDHRCQPGCRVAPAQQRGREAGDQRRPHPEGLEGQARQAAPEGPRCALDGQVQQGQAARHDGSMPPVDLAIPLFGYQNRVSIDCGFGFVRRWIATDVTANEGPGLLDKSNTASGVWADTAYRSAANEAFLIRNAHPSQEAEGAALTPGSSWAITRLLCFGFGGRNATRLSRRTSRATSSSSLVR